MDPSAVNVNITVDDFDSVLSYQNQSVWQTPDPSSPSFNHDESQWWMGTYHKTNVIGASLAFNFTGPSLFIYGHKGPDYGSFEVQIDSSTSTFSAYDTTNATGRTLLYSTTSLPYAQHTLALRNVGPKNGDGGGNALLFDYLQTTVQLAPAGATVSNTTFEEDNSALKYSGDWQSNKSPNFSGGGTSFTNKDKAAVSLEFQGSAVYVFGDKKNDHGLYSVVLDDRTPEIYNGISGCGGAFGLTCEQQKPTLQYIASNLNSSTHTLRIENIAGINSSFFDLDSIVVTVPSVYAPHQLSGTASATPTSSATTLPTSTASNSAVTSLPSHSLLLALMFLIFAVFRLKLP